MISSSSTRQAAKCTPDAQQSIVAQHLMHLRDLESRVTGILSAPQQDCGEAARFTLDAVRAEGWHRRHHLDRELTEMGAPPAKPDPPGRKLPTLEAVSNAATLALAIAGFAYERFAELATRNGDLVAARFAAGAGREIEAAKRAFHQLIQPQA